MTDRINCVVLAAGKGTRMRSNIAKVMHPIMGRPMIRYAIDAAHALSPRKIIVVTGHGQEEVESSLTGDDVSFALQAEQKGTAHALLAAEGLLEPGDILVLYGDVPLIRPSTLEAFADFFRASQGIAFMTTEVERPEGYGRVIVDEAGAIIDIVEDSEATGVVRDVRIINTGICMLRADMLPLVKAILPDNKKHEYYLTDICKEARLRGIAVGAFLHPDPGEVLGINTRKDLMEASLVVRNAILDRHMEEGVTIVDRSAYIEADVIIGPDTTVFPDSFLMGKTEIGRGATVGPHTVVRDSFIGDACVVEPFTHLVGLQAGEGVRIGPFSRIRPTTVLKPKVKIGNFVEVKNTTVGEGSKAQHLSYLGDSAVGSGVNIGAGTITCNYDGARKYRTVIEDGVFVGSNTELVAPVTIGKDAVIGAGTTVTKDVPEGALVVSRIKQRHIEGYSRRKKCAE